jgi:hypothetical protein
MPRPRTGRVAQVHLGLRLKKQDNDMLQAIIDHLNDAQEKVGGKADFTASWLVRTWIRNQYIKLHMADHHGPFVDVNCHGVTVIMRQFPHGPPKTPRGKKS